MIKWPEVNKFSSNEVRKKHKRIHTNPGQNKCSKICAGYLIETTKYSIMCSVTVELMYSKISELSKRFSVFCQRETARESSRTLHAASHWLIKEFHLDMQ